MATQTASAPQAPGPERQPPPYTTPPSLRNALYVLLALLAFLTAAWVALMGLDELAKDETTATRSLGAVHAVQLETDDGEITVRPGTGREATLETREWSGLLGGPELEVRNERGRLVVDSNCPGWFSNACGAELVLTVPRGVPVNLRTGSGDIEVAGVVGDAKLQTGSGEIEIAGLRDGDLTARTGSGDIDASRIDAGEVALRTGSGEIHVTGLAAQEVETRTGSGDIELTIADGTPPRSIFAHTGSGDVGLLVPDASYAVHTDIGAGDEDVQVRQDPDAPHRIDVETGSGDVEVRQR